MPCRNYDKIKKKVGMVLLEIFKILDFWDLTERLLGCYKFWHGMQSFVLECSGILTGSLECEALWQQRMCFVHMLSST